MSGSAASLRRKITSAGDLQSVVRTMKALAAASIGQYERSVLALADYCRAVELGLGACFREHPAVERSGVVNERSEPRVTGAIVFGSDQGLVGQFNDVIADYAIRTLAVTPGKAEVLAVGERVHARMANSELKVAGLFPAPASVRAIAPLVARIQSESEARRSEHEYARLYVFHNRPKPGGLYEPVSQRLLPLDAGWQRRLSSVPWPTKSVPEVISGGTGTLRALIREYLFISLFRACAESLASENASRLAAMQRADRNIDDLMATLHSTFHRLRQDEIDEELFDVIAGYEALSKVGSS